jgi:hypothetical protein
MSSRDRSSDWVFAQSHSARPAMTSWDISWRTEGSRVSKYGAQADEVLQIAATPRPGLGLVREQGDAEPSAHHLTQRR